MTAVTAFQIAAVVGDNFSCTMFMECGDFSIPKAVAARAFSCPPERGRRQWREVKDPFLQYFLA